MAGTSTLDPDNFPVDPKRGKSQKGHDTRSLGPSDSSDSGSDLAGPGLLDDDVLNLDRGTNEDSQAGDHSVADAGPSIGDLCMDENSDKRGTGEHLTAGKDPRMRVDGDRDTDQVVGGNDAGLGGGLDEAEEARLGVPLGKSGKKSSPKDAK
jgi:hypothetical protein